MTIMYNDYINISFSGSIETGSKSRGGPGNKLNGYILKRPEGVFANSLAAGNVYYLH